MRQLLVTGAQRSSAPQLIELLDGTGHERVRAAIESVAGDREVDISAMMLLTKSSSIWCPTAKGVRISVRSIGALIKALKQTKAEAEAGDVLR